MLEKIIDLAFSDDEANILLADTLGIADILRVPDYGYGYGDDYRYGDGDGYGNRYGDGDGYGDGNGYGDGYGW